MPPKGFRKEQRLDGLRRCPLCQQDLSVTAYTKANWRKGTGNPCRVCANAKERAFRAANREKVRQQENTWYHANRENALATLRKSKYGLSKAEFEAIFLKQRGRCLGCLSFIKTTPGKRNDLLTAQVDHDHITGKVRGLLCGACNTVLGFAKDNAMTLRRLMAYLSYDRAKTYVYIAGALKNTRVPEIGNLIRAAGFEVWDEWYGSGPQADIHWSDHQKQIGRSYPEALNGISAQNTYMFDRAHIDLADYVVLVMPSGKSSFIELGYALGSGKPGFILLEEEPDRPDLMTNFADIVVTSVDDLLLRLEKV